MVSGPDLRGPPGDWTKNPVSRNSAERSLLSEFISRGLGIGRGYRALAGPNKISQFTNETENYVRHPYAIT